MPNYFSVAPESGADALSVQVNSAGAVGARFDYLGRERCGTTAKPTVVLGTGAGTGASVTSVTGTDCDGNVTIQTGTSPTAGQVVFTMTFSAPYSSAPFAQLQPRDAGASALFYAVTTTTTLVVKSVNALPASTAVSLDFETCGGPS